MIAEMIKPIKEKKPKKEVSPLRREAGERLRAVRKFTLKISSTYDIAQKLRIPQSTYMSYELGTMEMGADFLTSLYKTFAVNPAYIVLNQDPIIKEEETTKSTLLIDVKRMAVENQTLKDMVEYLGRRVQEMEGLKADVIRLEQKVDGLS